MQRKILATAIASACFVPLVALADPSTVTLYGALNVDAEGVSATGCHSASPGTEPCANIPYRNRVSSNSSNFGIRGAEPLTDDGLKAIFQVEASAPLDSTANAAATAAGGPTSGSAGAVASRNSNLGLAGGFGTVFYGNWDTPYKSSTLSMDLFYGQAGNWYLTSILGGNSTPGTDNTYNRNSFDRRQQNSIQFWTPSYSGFQAKIAYSADERKSASTAAVGQNPDLWSLSLVYDNSGPFYGLLAFERHDEYANTATVQTKDTGVKLGLQYTWVDSTFGFIAEELFYEGNLYSATAPGVGSANAATTLTKDIVIGGVTVPVTTAVAAASSFVLGEKAVTAAAVGNATEARLHNYYLTFRQKIGAGTIRAGYGFDTGLSLNGNGSLPSSRATVGVLGYSYSLSKRTDLYAMYIQINNDNNSKNDLGGANTVSPAAGDTVRSLGLGIRHTF